MQNQKTKKNYKFFTFAFIGFLMVFGVANLQPLEVKAYEPTYTEQNLFAIEGNEGWEWNNGTNWHENGATLIQSDTVHSGSYANWLTLGWRIHRTVSPPVATSNLTSMKFWHVRSGGSSDWILWRYYTAFNDSTSNTWTFYSQWGSSSPAYEEIDVTQFANNTGKFIEEIRVSIESNYNSHLHLDDFYMGVWIEDEPPPLHDITFFFDDTLGTMSFYYYLYGTVMIEDSNTTYEFYEYDNFTMSAYCWANTSFINWNYSTVENDTGTIYTNPLYNFTAINETTIWLNFLNITGLSGGGEGGISEEEFNEGVDSVMALVVLCIMIVIALITIYAYNAKKR